MSGRRRRGRKNTMRLRNKQRKSRTKQRKTKQRRTIKYKQRGGAVYTAGPFRVWANDSPDHPEVGPMLKNF